MPENGGYLMRDEYTARSNSGGCGTNFRKYSLRALFIVFIFVIVTTIKLSYDLEYQFTQIHPKITKLKKSTIINSVSTHWSSTPGSVNIKQTFSKLKPSLASTLSPPPKTSALLIEGTNSLNTLIKTESSIPTGAHTTITAGTTTKTTPNKRHFESGGGINQDLSCKFPLLNPFDKTIQSYVDHPKGFNCEQIQPWLTTINYNGEIVINITEYQWINTESTPLDCWFRELERIGDFDITKTMYKLLELNVPMKFSTDVAEVTCIQNGSLVYNNFHAHPADLKRSFTPSDETHLSVQLMVLESTSLNMFRRHLPETYKYLTEQFGAFVFRGFNKVADNTFPNMIPMLVGKRVYNQQPGMLDEFNGTDYSKIYYDDWDLIWKQFAKRHGYATAFIEDKPEWGLFTYLARIDIGERITKKCMGARCFMYNFFTDMSHNDCCEIERADFLFKSFFKRVHQSSLMNNTILFVMGDHGHRYAPIRGTSVGFLEERLPMLAIRFPQWFLAKHPNIKESVALNQWRLATPFDIHETMLDILNENFDGLQRKEGTRGLSLFYPVPLNRNCNVAEIPEHFCTCTQSKTVNVTQDKFAGKAAYFLVAHINNLLIPLADNCANLTLKTLERADLFHQKVLPSAESVSQVKTETEERTSHVRQYRVLIQTEPSNALFEALVQVNTQSGDMSVPNDVSRINKYGSQSACINNKQLERYCYCQN